jgi:PD-(D/E)XK nuclease superfamily
MKVYLWETKTTSEDLSPGSSFWKRTIIDPQLSLYIPALQAMGHDPRGCLYDVLRKPAQKPSKKGETPERYGERCLAAIAEKPERYYARGVVVRLEAESSEAAADNWNTAAQMRDARRLNLFPRNPDSCMSWSRECEYLSVCAGLADITDPIRFQHEPANVELDGSDDLTLLSQSAMRSYRSCPRKYQYRYVMRQRPLKKPETLATGTSIHTALDVYRRTGGDLDAARAALVTTDEFVRAKEAAMLTGYAARWGRPTGIVAVEKQFQIPLINPETGNASRTFTLGGKVDAIVAVDAAGELMDPKLAVDDLEAQLEASLEAAQEG